MKQHKGMKHRIFAAFLCFCILLTLPGISDVFPVVAAGQSVRSDNIIVDFYPLSEEVRAQTVSVGTDLDELNLPDELTVYFEWEQESVDQKAEENEQEDTELGNTEEIADHIEETDIENEEGQDTESEEDTLFDEITDVQEEVTGDTANTVDYEDIDEESVPVDEQEDEVTQEIHIVTMPEYQAENVISVETLENAQGAMPGKTAETMVTINGITWQSEPEYDGNTEGTYIFTAVLPDGYTLTEGVSLPKITVIVQESEIDIVVQALLDRIAALPDAEEYLSEEPEEDEEAYAEWEEKLYEYAEEVLAIWEEYGAMTEEQQAQVPEEVLSKLTAWVELAEQLSESDTVMLADSGHHVGWTALSDSDTALSGGEYYLANDIKMGTITIDGEVTLCLNGHTLTHEGDTGSVIVVNSGKFTLCDCSGNDSGCITGGKGTEHGSSVYGGGICVVEATFIMEGGTIKGNGQDTATNGGGISIGVVSNTNTSKFIMSGGSVRENAASSVGGGIFIQQGSEVIISNADISDNVTPRRGGGIGTGTFTNVQLSDVEITGNEGSQGGGFFMAANNGELHLSGHINISGNTNNGTANNLFLMNKKVITIDEELTGSIGVMTQWKPDAGREDPNAPFITIVQGAQGENGNTVYELSAQDFSCFSSDDGQYSVLMVDDKADSGRGKVFVLGNESAGNLSDMKLSIKDSSSGEEIKLDPEFVKTIYKYTATVPNSVETVAIEAIPENADADVVMTIQNKVNATNTIVDADNIPLAEGENTIRIIVDEGSASKVYTVVITREEAKGNPITITAYKDGEKWKESDKPPVFKLTSDSGTSFVTDLTAVPDGTYKIYDGNTDTGVEVTVAGAEAAARIDYYTVTFYDKDTVLADPAQQTVLKGTAASAPASDPKKQGYTFGKWVTADGGSTKYDFTAAVTGKTSVYTSWILDSYSITYQLGGGKLPAGETNPAVYNIETPAFTLKNPERDGYEFTGWSGTDLTGSDNKSVTIAAGSTEDRTYTANWKAAGYTVTLHKNDGGSETSQTSYTYGTGVTLTAVTGWTRTGYTFDGWYDNAQCTGTAVTEISVTDIGDKEYWAKWTANKYEVSFAYHGADSGNTTDKITVTYDSTYGALPVPVRTGYSFQGWYTAENGQGSKVEAATVVNATSAHTLHAHWLDDIKPDKPVLQAGVTLPADWTGTQKTLPLSLYDGVGVTELWVSIDGKDYIKVDGFTGGTGSTEYDYTLTEGEHTYQFKAKDAAGNTSEESDLFTVRLDTAKPEIGAITYENKVTSLWNWIIGKKSLIIHVRVTDEGSGVTQITYTMTPRDSAGNPDTGSAVTDTADVKNGEAQIKFNADFKGTITISCTDAAGNTADSVTIGASGGGVIVEDNAPVITADGKKDYYDTAEDIHVTVKDDTGSVISAGIDTVTYQVGEDGTEKTVTIDKSTLQAAEEVAFTIPASEIPTGITEIKITATDNAGNTRTEKITVKVKGPEKQPAAKIDYREEELTGLVPGGQYKIDGTEITADAEGHIEIKEEWLGTTLSIVKKGNGSETSDSTAQSLPIPARPAAPNAPELNSRTEQEIVLKTISGAQFRIENGGWQDSTNFAGLTEKTEYSFKAYYPATDTSFASPESSEAQIATMPYPPAKEKLVIDYTGETMTLTDGIEAFSDAGCTTPVTAGSAEDYMGTMVYIRYPAKGIIPASKTTAVQIPARPGTPTPAGKDASYPGAADGVITGLTAGVTYMVSSDGGRTWETKTADTGGAIAGLKAGTYEVYVAAGSANFRSETADVTIGEKPATKQDTPNIQIDYENRTLTGFLPDGEYTINGEKVTVKPDGTMEIKAGWFDSILSIIRKGNGKDKLDSDPQSLSVPAIPAKPTPTGVDVETAGGTGKLTGLTAGTTYEVSTDGGRTWETKTADGNGEITGLAPGSYTVRVKAGTSNFASEPSDPAKIGAYQIKVTFMVDGEVYDTISVDYGGALTNIPAVPSKDGMVGEWCVDEQGSSSAAFTNITADMTVYAVYTTAYTVTLQPGTGYTLTAAGGSTSPVKEGTNFSFRLALSSGYITTSDFAVKVNGTKVDAVSEGNGVYTYTITDIRENKTVTVEGIKKDESKPNPPSGGGNDGDGGNDPDPEPVTPPTETPTETETETPEPPSPPTPQPAETPDDKPGTTPSTPENVQPEDDSEPESTETPEPTGTEKEPETVPASTDNDRIVISGEPIRTGNVNDMTDTSTTLSLGDGAIIVTVVCRDQTYTAGVADTVAVANAVLTQEQLELINSGETIEIRIEVTDISDSVPGQDKEVIESGIEEYSREVPGLTLGMYVDLSMFIRIGAGDWNAITATKEPIEVIIGVPDSLQEKSRTYYIIRAHEGEYTFMSDMDNEPDTITISTDMFSSYAIAYVQAEGKGAKCGLCHICPTFLGICYFIWLAIIILLIIIVIVILHKRKEQEQEREDI